MPSIHALMKLGTIAVVSVSAAANGQQAPLVVPEQLHAGSNTMRVTRNLIAVSDEEFLRVRVALSTAMSEVVFRWRGKAGNGAATSTDVSVQSVSFLPTALTRSRVDPKAFFIAGRSALGPVLEQWRFEDDGAVAPEWIAAAGKWSSKRVSQLSAHGCTLLAVHEAQWRRAMLPTKISALFICFVGLFSVTGHAQSAGWRGMKSALRPLTQGELDALNAKLDEAAAQGYEFTYGRPNTHNPPVRMFTMSRRKWVAFHGSVDFGGESLPPPEVPEDGVPEIALDPAVLDPDAPPGEVASVVNHEMGHVENPDSADEEDDGSVDVDGQIAHFRIYASELKELCDYISFVKNEGAVHPWYYKLCEMCARYDDARRHANNNLRRHVNDQAIYKCLGCVDC